MNDERKPKRQLIAELVALRGELSRRGSQARPREIKQELAASGEVFAAISEQTLMGIVLVQDFRVVYTNRKYSEISEFSFDEILSWTLQDMLKIVHPEDLEFVIGQLRKKQAGETEGIVTAYSYRGITKTGKVRWLEQHSRTVNCYGRPADLIALVDTTERRAAEEELRSARAGLARRVEERTADLRLANEALASEIEQRKRVEDDLRLACEELQALDKLKDNFISTISHELRTPLVSAKGYTELLLEGESLGDRHREWVARIHNGILRLQAIIDDLLDISRFRSGSMTLAIFPVDVDAAIDKTIKTLKPRLSERRMKVVTQLPPDLPAIMADPHRLQSVLLNIIENAVKFSPDHGEITISAREAGPSVVIAIRDPGIGIEPSEQEKVFKRFYQVDSSMTRLHGGAGIGLALVKDIVELHGGKVWVESVLGEGATFSFSMPADRARS